jgi:hypothetical protein
MNLRWLRWSAAEYAKFMVMIWNNLPMFLRIDSLSRVLIDRIATDSITSSAYLQVAVFQKVPSKAILELTSSMNSVTYRLISTGSNIISPVLARRPSPGACCKIETGHAVAVLQPRYDLGNYHADDDHDKD